MDNNKIKFNCETMKVKLCKVCHGLGIVQDLNGDIMRCPNCHGTGRLIEEKMTNELTLDSVDYGQCDSDGN